MKTFSILFSILFICSFKILAQSSLIVTDISNAPVTIQNNGYVFLTTTSESSETTTINIKNTGSITKSYKLKRYDDVLNNNAEALFEIGNIGYVPTIMLSPTAVTLTANGTSNDDLLNQDQLFKLHLFEDATPGISHVRYEIFDVNNISDLFTFSIYYNDLTTSVKNNTLMLTSISEAYPNPCNDKTQFTISSSEIMNDLTISITNTIGAEVSSQKANLEKGENNITIDSGSLSSGIYFATISFNKTKIVKKFTVNK